MKNIPRQAASAVLMVQPQTFGFDKQTARTNSFQNESKLTKDEILRRASDEFNLMVEGLRSHGVFVSVFKDPDQARKPNAVFPNNWLSTWGNGDVYLYPMATKSRRMERSYKLIGQLSQQFRVRHIVDLSGSENDGKYLESTGVMIFDHIHEVVYGCISERCDERLFNEHAKTLGYKPVLFHAYDRTGKAIYHTNVMMGVQSTTAVICSESITDEVERTIVLACLRATGRTVVEITQDQMAAFCGNVLELQNDHGERFLIMSQSAYDNFTDDQRIKLKKDKTLLPFAIPTIESIGGGSVRCMLAELFLVRRGVLASDFATKLMVNVVK